MSSPCRWGFSDKASCFKRIYTRHQKSRKWVLVVSRGKCTFKQSDLTRALKATKAAGVDVAKIEIEPDGRMVMVLSGKEGNKDSNDTSGNPWDEVT
jgi:hypothetical protein